MAADEAVPKHTNRLVHEKSPYLLQHAHNPVDWYPWGEEALARAVAEDKPIFVSIGYSTCHWCHVMEHESFENEEIAALMNQWFVCIKVDREERPDLDEIYMAAVQAMTGQGGWPMSVFLTPDRKPFFGGTYFPPEDRFGRPGFPTVLRRMHELWTEERSRVEEAADQMTASLAVLGRLESSADAFDLTPVDGAYAQIVAAFDPVDGGFGGAPKFPRADYGSLCLRVYRRTGDEKALRTALETLDHMAAGGIYDQLGGGFARYSVDQEWLVPHFEKMLYDNAQLAFHYLEAYQLTGDEEYARVVREIFDYVLRDMTDPRGGFYSAEDADSEGVEGKFYVWSEDEIREVLDDQQFAAFSRVYGVSREGNFEGSNILHRAMSPPEAAAELGVDPELLESRLAESRRLLFERREHRVRPGRDDKVLAAWNGLMIHALARGAVVLDEPRYLEAARRAADFVLDEMRQDGQLLRRWRGGKAGIPAYAEDHAMVVAGLLELYQAGFELEYFAAALRIHRQMMEHFVDENDGALYNTRAGESDLLVRVKTGYDGSVPTANSVAAYNMLSLYELTGEAVYLQQLEKLLRAFQARLQQQPLAMVRMLLALDAYLGERTELVLAGPLAETLPLLREARSGYHPDLFISYAPGDPESLSLIPSLEGKESGAEAIAYVCRGFACRRPTGDPSEMRAQLALRRAEAGASGAD